MEFLRGLGSWGFGGMGLGNGEWGIGTGELGIGNWELGNCFLQIFEKEKRLFPF